MIHCRLHSVIDGPNDVVTSSLFYFNYCKYVIFSQKIFQVQQLPPQPKDAWVDDEENDQEIEDSNKADDDYDDEESLSERQELENEIGNDNDQVKSIHNNSNQKSPLTSKPYDLKNKSSLEQEQVNGFMVAKPNISNFAL